MELIEREMLPQESKELTKKENRGNSGDVMARAEAVVDCGREKE